VLLKDDNELIFNVVEKRPEADFVIQECDSREEADKLASRYNFTGDYSYYVQEHFVLGMRNHDSD